MIINNTVGRGGSSGKDGVTPHIGDNGNWFLGTEDTGVVAKAQGNTKIAEVMLLATDWDESLAQTIACEGISANEANQMVTLLPALANKAVYSSCRVTCTAFAENSLTFMAESLPEEDILVYVAMEDEHASVASNVYSLEETVVGTWIDGKPIYQRTFVATVSPVSGSVKSFTMTADINVNNAALVGNDVATFDPVHNHMTGGLTEWSGAASNVARWSALLLTATGLEFFARDAESHTITVYATVRYTKATDTATIEIPTATALIDSYEEGVNEA